MHTSHASLTDRASAMRRSRPRPCWPSRQALCSARRRRDALGRAWHISVVGREGVLELSKGVR